MEKSKNPIHTEFFRLIKKHGEEKIGTTTTDILNKIIGEVLDDERGIRLRERR